VLKKNKIVWLFVREEGGEEGYILLEERTWPPLHTGQCIFSQLTYTEMLEWKTDTCFMTHTALTLRQIILVTCKPFGILVFSISCYLMNADFLSFFGFIIQISVSF